MSAGGLDDRGIVRANREYEHRRLGEVIPADAGNASAIGFAPVGSPGCVRDRSANVRALAFTSGVTSAFGSGFLGPLRIAQQ